MTTIKSDFFLLISMTRINIILLCFLAIIGFFLLTEHWAHVYGYWPYLLLLACPLLHIFGHGGHGGGHGGHGNDESTSKKSSSSSHHHHG